MELALVALVAGFLHVVSGPDHLAAVSPFSVGGQGRSWLPGLHWGLGHGTGAFGVGALAFLSRDALPLETIAAWGERAVGLALVAIGISGTRLVRARHRVHGHVTGEPHRHHAARATFAVGTVHGLAGGSHLLGVLPALALASDCSAGIYLLAFGTGGVAAMGTFSSLVGWIGGRLGGGGIATRSALLDLFSAVAIAIGVWWLLADAAIVPLEAATR